MPNYIWPTITPATKIDELKEIHRQIWDYVLTHELSKPMTRYIANCSACEYVFRKENDLLPFSAEFCEHCPIKWPNGMICPLDESLYEQFLHYKGMYLLYKRNADLCKTFDLVEQIRNVEWKDDLP